MNSSVIMGRCFIKMLPNSTDPDQTAPKEQSDQGLHCLLLHLLFKCLGSLQYFVS